MKKLLTTIVALFILTPAFAMALSPSPAVAECINTPLEERDETCRTLLENFGTSLERYNQQEIKAKVSSTTPPKPRLGPAIKDIASSTRALSSSTVEMVKARVEAIKQLIEKKREDMKHRADNARQIAKERFGEHVETLVGKVSVRLASTSANLSAIADRMDARIDTLQDEGHDMDGSIALLATARTDISAANDKILAVNTALEAAMGTTTPKAQMPAVRAAVKAAEDALKLAKDDLMKTLRSIKVEAGATTTVSN